MRLLDRLLNILHEAAKRRGTAAIATTLIVVGGGLLAGGSFWLAVAIWFASAFGVSVPAGVSEAASSDWFTRLIGILFVIGGPIFWFCTTARPSKARLSLDLRLDSYWLLFGIREPNGVFLGDGGKYTPGGGFYFQAGGVLVALGDDIELHRLEMTYSVDGPSLLNLEPFLTMFENEVELRNWSMIKQPCVVKAQTSVDFAYVRHVKTNRPENQCPVDCEQGTMTLALLYRGSNDLELRLDRYTYLHNDNGDYVLKLKELNVPRGSAGLGHGWR